MATEKPRSDENDERVEQDQTAEPTEDSNASSVDEQSEDSFPASDPPSF